jgi:ABC-type transport system involved in multi-copper enzyme maturation permease subunit
MPELAKWDNFYVIVGSAAGALVGLQFVVLALIAERPSESFAEAGAAFGSPTVVHFSVALFISAMLNAPWQAVTTPAAIWGILGFVGVAYAFIVLRRMLRQGVYKPEFEDWMFHVFLPLIAYATLALSPFAAFSHAHEAFFGVAAASLLLLFIGIHNAWDSVSYHVFVTMPARNGKERREKNRGKTHTGN